MSSNSQIPKFDICLSDSIPSYAGDDPRGLYRFIKRIKQIKDRYYDPQDPQCEQNEIIYYLILNKLYGLAKKTVSIMSAQTIDEIANALIGRFADKRGDFFPICLHIMRQEPNETPYEFYYRFEEIVSEYRIYTELNMDNKQICEDRCKRFEENALKVFVFYLEPQYRERLINTGAANLIRGPMNQPISLKSAKAIDEIANTLVKNFSVERGNFFSLYLHAMRQEPNETPYEFHDRVLEIVFGYRMHTKLNVDNEEIREDRCKWFENNALKVFLKYLEPYYRDYLRYTGATSLQKAIETIKIHDTHYRYRIQEY